jgi:hypothetical protein
MNNKPSNRLTPKQRAFVYEYLKDFNATAAVRRAGYRGSTATLSAVASDNLARPAVRSRINTLLDQWAMPAKEVLLRLSRLASSSMADFVNEEPAANADIDLLKGLRLGAMDHVRYLVLDERRSPEGLVNRRVEISLYDSVAALTLLARSYTLPDGALTDSITNPGLPEEAEPLTLEEFALWSKQSKVTAREWLLQTWGDIETGVLAVSKQVFGENFRPTREYILNVAHTFDNNIPSLEPGMTLTFKVEEDQEEDSTATSEREVDRGEGG